MIYIGIDNGLNGGIVAINEKQEVISADDNILKYSFFDDDKLVFAWLMPIIKGQKGKIYDIKKIIEIFDYLQLSEEKIFVVLEKAHIMPQNGGRANFTTGECYGIIKGILSSLNIPYEIVSAKIWQKDIFQGQTIKDTKQSSIMYCKNKFPNIDWRASKRCKNAHDGLTDAACMAVYCYRLNR